MKIKAVYRLSVVLFLFTLSARSQRANTWYFGANAGLNFNTVPPTVLTNGQTNNPDNTSAISDVNGSLLFYTDGVSVWNNTHGLMQNGTGLIGHYSAGQCALIVPIPCSASKYVIFHVTEFSSPGTLHYTVVDMTLNNGLGAVVSSQKNISLGTGWTEKLCAYYNAAANSYWVLTHKWNSNQFVAFEVNSTLIAVNSVTSSIGSVHNCGSYGGTHDGAGQLTISPGGTKVANALSCQNIYEVFDFNSATGSLSNSIAIPGSSGSAWGTAISPDNTKLYVNTILGQTIYQYDLTVYNQTAVLASQHTIVTVATGGYNFGYMEMGPDNKLYITRPSLPFLAVVNNPNSLAGACNFSLAGQSLGAKNSNHGLSRIAYNIPSNTGITTISVASSPANGSICAGSSATLTASGAASYSWSVPGSGPSMVVTPSVTTVYSVSTSGTCGVSTGSVLIQVVPAPLVSITGASLICRGQSLALSASGAGTYSWSGGSTGAILAVSPVATSTYSVTGTNAQGCTKQAFFTVNVDVCEGLETLEGELFTMYPNPVRSMLTIVTKEDARCSEMKIVAANGELVYTVNPSILADKKEQFQVDLQFLETGFYIIHGICGGTPVTYKLLKE